MHLQEASDGSQSAFMVSWYRTNSGAYGGFGMFSTFSKAWSLPADRTQWRNYTAAFDFKERFGKPCLLEIQLKNKNETNAAGQFVQKAIHFTKPYTPGTNGWITISASLDQFIQHKDFAPFDPSRVDALVLNVQMLEKHPTTNVIYVASFDNIRFDARNGCLGKHLRRLFERERFLRPRSVR